MRHGARSARRSRACIGGGVDHADLNAHNILLDGRGAVSVIDFDRGRVRERGAWTVQKLQPAAPLAREDIAAIAARPILRRELGVLAGRLRAAGPLILGAIARAPPLQRADDPAGARWRSRSCCGAVCAIEAIGRICASASDGGRLPADSPSIWLHAVSLGEVSAAAALVRALRARYPTMPFVLTTATPTGRARAQALFGSDIDMRFLPYDTPGSVRRFLTRIRPRLAIIMETELWPNLLHECRRRGVPVVLANARLTPKSVSRYRRLGALFRDALATNTLVAAQSPEDAERFIALGADRARTHVIGNMKFDVQLGGIEHRARDASCALRYAGARPVWIAGSTHAGEEEQLLEAHAALSGDACRAPC